MLYVTEFGGNQLFGCEVGYPAKLRATGISLFTTFHTPVAQPAEVRYRAGLPYITQIT